MRKKSLVGWAWIREKEPLLKWTYMFGFLLVDIPRISKGKPKIGIKVKITIEEI